MNDRPFGFDTLDIQAVLVTEGDETSAHPFGPDTVTVPVVLVPPGGQAPGGDYFCAGVVMRPRRGSAAANQPEDRAEQPDEREDTALPRTRFRFGTGVPRNPGSGGDPAATGVKAWRGMAEGRAGAGYGVVAAPKTPPAKASTPRPEADAAQKI